MKEETEYDIRKELENMEQRDFIGRREALERAQGMGIDTKDMVLKKKGQSITLADALAQKDQGLQKRTSSMMETIHEQSEKKDKKKKAEQDSWN